MTYSVVSLFSGAGFLDFGFSESGFNVIWGAEIEPEFARAHNYNSRLRYNHHEIIETADITNVKPQDIPKSVGIIGGPPCQDFSIANANNPGVTGKRGQLVWDFLKKIDYLRPDFFLFENVESLYRTKKHRQEALYPLLNTFNNDLNYVADFRVLNSLDYGIPQDRSRVFIIGIKKNLTTYNNFNIERLWPTPKYKNAKERFHWPSKWEFGKIINEEKYIANLKYPYKLTVHSLINDEEQISQLPNHVHFNPRSNKFSIIEEGDDGRKSFKRLHRFRYSPTAAYGNNEVHLHPTKPRRLSVREALRIQSVPDWYMFPDDMTLTDMFKMISNGVPFKLSKLIAKNIYNFLNECNEQKEILNENYNKIVSI